MRADPAFPVARGGVTYLNTCRALWRSVPPERVALPFPGPRRPGPHARARRRRAARAFHLLEYLRPAARFPRPSPRPWARRGRECASRRDRAREGQAQGDVQMEEACACACTVCNPKTYIYGADTLFVWTHDTLISHIYRHALEGFTRVTFLSRDQCFHQTVSLLTCAKLCVKGPCS